MDIDQFVFFNCRKRSGLFLYPTTTVQGGAPKISNIWLSALTDAPARYGIAIMGSDTFSIDQAIIAGFEYAIYFSTGTFKNYAPSISNVHLETRTIESGSQTRWSNGLAITAGDLIVPTKENATGWIYEAQGNGTTDATEPDWTTAIPDLPDAGEMTAYTESVVDNDVTWLARWAMIAIADESDAVIVADNVYSDYIALYATNAGGASFRSLRQVSSNNSNDIAAINIGSSAGQVVTFHDTQVFGEIKTLAPGESNTGMAFACYNCVIEDNSQTVGRYGQLPTNNELDPAGSWDENKEGKTGEQILFLTPSGVGQVIEVPLLSVATRAHYLLKLEWIFNDTSGGVDGMGTATIPFHINGTTVAFATANEIDEFSPGAVAPTVANTNGTIELTLNAALGKNIMLKVSYISNQKGRIDWNNIAFV